MHYYQFNIGDYRRDTQHLTPLEHGIYRLLLDQFYLTEKPLDANALRLLCIRSADDVRVAESILKEFFVDVGNGTFIHKRAETEIAKYRDKSSKAANSAKVRWGHANAMRTHSEGNANHKPITNNHKPVNKTPSAANAIALDGTTWLNTEPFMDSWIDAYPAINIKTEMAKAAAWLVANPKNRKSNYARFLTNWFTRAQDRAPPTGTKQPASKPVSKLDGYLGIFKEKCNERDITSASYRVDQEDISTVQLGLRAGPDEGDLG